MMRWADAGDLRDARRVLRRDGVGQLRGRIERQRRKRDLRTHARHADEAFEQGFLLEGEEAEERHAVVARLQVGVHLDGRARLGQLRER